jgi:hypothetical protein
MVLLGFSAASALLASTSAIMAASPKEKAVYQVLLVSPGLYY